MTNPFEYHYKSLLSYAGAVIINNNLQLEAGDLVNDAYIKFIETERPFDKKEFTILISKAAYRESDGKMQRMDVSTPKKLYSSRGDICCNRCHEVKPINAFEVVTVKGVEIVRKICRHCNNRQRRERYRLNPKTNLPNKPKVIPLALAARKKPVGRPRKYKYSNDLQLKDVKKLRFKKWVETNRDKWNAYCRERSKNMGRGTGLTREEYNKKRNQNKIPLKQLRRMASKRYQEKQKQNLTDQYIKHLLKMGGKDFSPPSIEKKRLQLLSKRTAA